MGFDTGLDSTSHQPWCIPPFLLQDQWDAQMRREVSNDLSLVRTVLADLQHAGFEVLLIGGWAEELQGVTERRVHQDVDVVLLDPPNDALEAFVAEHDEVVEKRLTQKRAYRAQGVLVELFLAGWTGAEFRTIWWGRLSWSWPSDMSPTTIAALPVASKAVLQAFRDSYGDIMAARPW
jgi:hypothetical protein